MTFEAAPYLGMSCEDMSSGACKFASARHFADMLRNAVECLVDMSARSPTCQWPEGGVDADMSADADMSSSADTSSMSFHLALTYLRS